MQAREWERERASKALGSRACPLAFITAAKQSKAKEVKEETPLSLSANLKSHDFKNPTRTAPIASIARSLSPHVSYISLSNPFHLQIKAITKRNVSPFLLFSSHHILLTDSSQLLTLPQQTQLFKYTNPTETHLSFSLSLSSALL